MLVNRVGDLGLLIAISIIFITFGSLKYSIIFNLVNLQISLNILFFGINFNVVGIIGFFLFIGAMGKSAQLGLHV
jgi:NADH-quinone oxidoreductase subunit L